LVLRRIDTVKVIRQPSNFTGEKRPQVPFRAIFQAQTGTGAELAMFSKRAGKLPHMKELKSLEGLETTV
jgi:hypothetical protein